MTRQLFDPRSIEDRDDVSIPKYTLDMLKFGNIKPYTGNEKGDRCLSNFLSELEAIIRSSVPISIKSDPSRYDKLRAQILLFYLKEEAFRFYCTLGLVVQNSFLQTKAALKRRFEERINPRILLSKLRNLKQGKLQSVEEIKCEVVELVQKYMELEPRVANDSPSNRAVIENYLLCENFLEALDDDIHDEIISRYRDDGEFSDLVERALWVENFFLRCRGSRTLSRANQTQLNLVTPSEKATSEIIHDQHNASVSEFNSHQFSNPSAPNSVIADNSSNSSYGLKSSLFLMQEITLPSVSTRVRFIKLPREIWNAWRGKTIKITPSQETIRSDVFVVPQIVTVNKRSLPIVFKNLSNFESKMPKNIELGFIEERDEEVVTELEVGRTPVPTSDNLRAPAPENMKTHEYDFDALNFSNHCGYMTSASWAAQINPYDYLVASKNHTTGAFNPTIWDTNHSILSSVGYY